MDVAGTVKNGYEERHRVSDALRYFSVHIEVHGISQHCFVYLHSSM